MTPKKTVLFLIFVWQFAVCDRSVWSQDDLKVLAYYSTTQLRFQLNGKMVEHSFGRLSIAPIHPLERFLYRENFLNDLLLTETQSGEIEALLKFFEAGKKKIKQNPNATDLMNPSEEIVSSFQALKKEFAEKLEEILLPHQISRSEELVLRSALRRFGFYKFLLDFANANDLEMTASQRKEVKISCREFQSTIDEKLKTLESELRDRIYDVLDESQVAAIKERFEGGSWMTDFLFQEIERQPDNSLVLGIRPEGTAEEDYDFVERLRENVVMTWVPEDCSWDISKVKQPRTAAVRELVGSLLNIEEVSRGLSVTEEQIEDLARVYKIDTEALTKTDKEYSSAIKSGGDLRAAHERMRNSYTEREEILISAVSNQILLPHQKQAIVSLIQKRVAMRKGPIVLLYTGEFDELLALSEKQKEKVKAEIRKGVAKLKETLYTMEQSFIDDTLELLDSEFSKSIASKLGEKPKYSIPSIFMLRKMIAKMPMGM